MNMMENISILQIFLIMISFKYNIFAICHVIDAKIKTLSLFRREKQKKTEIFVLLVGAMIILTDFCRRPNLGTRLTELESRHAKCNVMMDIAQMGLNLQFV